jgi:hypothetical protein
MKKMKTYLRKIIEKTNIEIVHKGLLVEVCAKLTSTLCSFPSKGIINALIIPLMIKKIIIRTFKKFPLGILVFTFEIHCWQIIRLKELPKSTLYAIFLESYEDVIKKDNYFLTTLLPY